MDLYNLAIARKLSSGGGGNPNTVETVTGTASNPWGTIDLQELITAITHNEATAICVFDGTALGAGSVTGRLYPMTIDGEPSLGCSGANIYALSMSDVIAFEVVYKPDGSCHTLRFVQSNAVSDVTQYAPMFTTTLTVIWHPLPS